MSHDAHDLPRPFGPYLLLRRLAVGGMAEVYVARARGVGGFEKLVAIKVIHPRFSEDPHFTELLVEEAKIAVLLTHVNIGQIFDLGVVDGTYYIALEYIEGADAWRLLRKAGSLGVTLPLDVCMFLAAGVCHGLDHAHRKRDAEGRPLGIVHRDISPQNVLVSFHGEVKIVDFGIAKAALRSGQTEAGVIKGKYYYMSPEQAWGDPMDHRSDIFSAGIVLYELLIGEMLYREDSIPALLDRVRKADIAPPERRRADIPPALSAVVMRALAREPERRFQSAHEMAQALVQLLYATSPSFTASRVAALMQELFPEDLQRNAELLTRGVEPQTAAEPPSTRTAVGKRAPLGGAPTRVAGRASPTQRELPSVPAPSAAAPGMFALGDDDDEDDRTRNDVPALQRAMAMLVAGDRAAGATGTALLPVAHTRTDKVDAPGGRDEATRAVQSPSRREVSTRSLLSPDGASRDFWEDEPTSILDGDASARVFAQLRRGAAGGAGVASRPETGSDAGWSEDSTVIEDGETVAAARAFIRVAAQARAAAAPASPPPGPAPTAQPAASLPRPAEGARARTGAPRSEGPAAAPTAARPAASPSARPAAAPAERPAASPSVRPAAAPAERPAASPSVRPATAPSQRSPDPPRASRGVAPAAPAIAPAARAAAASARSPAPRPRSVPPPERRAAALPAQPAAQPASRQPVPAQPAARAVQAQPAPTAPPEVAPLPPVHGPAQSWPPPASAPHPFEAPPYVDAPHAVAAPEAWPPAPPWAGGASPLAAAPLREPVQDPFAAPPAGASTGAYAALFAEGSGRRRALWLGLLGIGLLVATFAGVSAFLTSRPVPQPARVTSVPMGAQVKVDGVAIPGVTPLVLSMPLDPERAHAIDVTLDGFHPYRIEVPIGDRQPNHLAILTPR